MTQTQKIIARTLGADNITAGARVYISESTDAVSFDEKLCGAYGKLFLKEKIFTVPEGIFIDLEAPLRNDITSEKIADFVADFISKLDVEGKSLEFGGDSMTYLTMDDRFAVVEKLLDLEKKPFCVIFEYDYITAEYTFEHFGKKPETFYNDGPQSYEQVVTLELDKA